MLIWIQMWILDHFSILFTVAEKGNLGDVLPFLVSHADFYETRRNDWRW